MDSFFKKDVAFTFCVLEHAVNLSPVLVSYFLLMKKHLKQRFSGAVAICVYCGCVFNLRGRGLHWQRGRVTLTVSDKTAGPEKRARSNLIAAQAERMEAELMRGLLCVPCAFQIRRKTKLACVPSIKKAAKVHPSFCFNAFFVSMFWQNIFFLMFITG